MKTLTALTGTRKKWQICFSLAVIFLSFSTAGANPAYTVKDFESWPSSIITSGENTPKVVINSSNDHQLFFKAYSDYGDIDEDGIPETTYKHSIDYYGYFDSYKCYEYDTVDKVFRPKAITTDKYCVDASPAGPDNSGYWSGNLLNWATMARIDVIRKILFGGHRRVDTSTETVLERTYLPHDAHSWAKYYDGDDLQDLTPFVRGVDYDCDQGDLSGCQDVTGNLDRLKIGITFGNTTDVDMPNKLIFSEEVPDPPVLKTVKGNYSLWASNERWQVTWASGAPYDNHAATNANDPARSGIYAYGSSPAYSEGIGEKNYVVRVQVCVGDSVAGNSLKGALPSDSLINTESCKLYPGPDGNSGTADDVYKPKGLLQIYGDEGKFEFAMVAGSYYKHASGGVLIKTMGSFQDEVDVNGDGTFPKVAAFAGGPLSNSSPQRGGLVNAWSLYRITGYDGNAGTYWNSKGDNCNYNISDADVISTNKCKNWGNPFSEIYYQSLNYLAGGGVIGDYRSNSSTGIPGLPVPLSLADDPIDATEYCAPLFVVNLNSSIPSFDDDEFGGQSSGTHTIWDPATLPGDSSPRAMTDVVGAIEGIHGNDFFVGATATDTNQMCTPKTVDALGDVNGVCPEIPRKKGSYKIAGLAYYAHISDIRPDNATGNRDRQGPQTVDTFSVAMASNVPVVEIPDPATGETAVTLLPACRNLRNTPDANCGLVDFKIVSREIDATTNIAKGKLYIDWESEEQGSDYDQDMWGTLLYELDGTTNTLSITTDTYTATTGAPMAFGYILDGTDNDGFHAHSGIKGFKDALTASDTADTGPDCTDSNGCQVGDGPSTKEYTLSVAGATKPQLLKDPLWYTAKYGGFTDLNGNQMPDIQEEWDKKDNETGELVSDGIPDNYFYSRNPRQLESALKKVFDAILERTSSGTAAAVVSSNVRGEGALYQAYYEPLKKDNDDAASWLGTVQALWLDSSGLARQDCSPPRGYDATNDVCIPPTGPCVPNGQLDNYCVDQVTETFFDELEGRTRVRVYDSNDPYAFEPYSMQGVVATYSGGTVALVPNAMEGLVSTYDNSNGSMTISPYTMTGTVTAYDPVSGALTVSVAAGSWQGPGGRSFSNWRIQTSSGPGFGYSTDTIVLEANGALNLTINPAGTWLGVGDTLTFETQGTVGLSGEAFNNWSVECLQGTTATGDIVNYPITLRNWDGATFTVTDPTADFSTCTMVKLSTFDMRGTACDTFSDWKVFNLSTGVNGTSITPVTLVNSLNEPGCTPAGTDISLNVDPTLDWITPGDRILISNFQFTDKELYTISYLWNAREELYLDTVNDTTLATNRSYGASADTGRYIKTWIDSNLDSKVDANEYVALDKSIFSSGGNQGFFDVDTVAEAEEVVDFTRGIEVAGTRNRTIKYTVDDATKNVMRLGDIVNSTPSVVGSPQEAFNLLYSDGSYTAFRQKYARRRIMIYAGSNDGLIHAFNGGFFEYVTDTYGNRTIKYSTLLTDSNGNDLGMTGHPLGSEIWAYAPKNTISHLKWLKDPDYGQTHVFLIDGKPRIFDANIFYDDADHPNGWGTVMVVSMKLGGGEMELDTASNDPGPNADNIIVRSAYVIFDITNPEVEPTLLGEIQIPDGSFTTVYPAVIAFRDVGTNTNCAAGTAQCNSWYLVFGTGPDNLVTAESSQTAKLYLFELSQLTKAGPALPDAATTTVPVGCSVQPLTATSNVITCDTNVATSFVGTPVAVDWNLDFYADTAYFGLVGDQSSTAGQLMRFSFQNDVDPANWNSPHTLFQANQPVSIQPVPAVDNRDNKWLFFGTGRYFALGDKNSTATQALYGVKDDESGTTVGINELLDVTDTEVYADRSLTGAPPPLVDGTDTFDDLETEIDDVASGWFLNLPPISGTAGTAPATRAITNQALIGGVLFSSVFQPSTNPCEGEGLSRLYGLYYKTGTAYPGPTVFGNSIDNVGGQLKLRSLKYYELGRGVATAPAVHSGADSGDDSLSVFTQLSTGDILRKDVKTVNPVRTGKVNWREQ